jgi:hypothetical protein
MNDMKKNLYLRIEENIQKLMNNHKFYSAI